MASAAGILFFPPTVLSVFILPSLIQLMMVKRETPQSFANSVVDIKSLSKLSLLIVMGFFLKDELAIFKPLEFTPDCRNLTFGNQTKKANSELPYTSSPSVAVNPFTVIVPLLLQKRFLC
jgi:hypothetical protein